jgi:hypothetical protein
MEIAELGVEVEFLPPESEEAVSHLRWSSAGVAGFVVSDNGIERQVKTTLHAGSNDHLSPVPHSYFNHAVAEQDLSAVTRSQRA